MTWLGRLIHNQDTRTPLREGFLGIGGSSSKTDRTNQLNATTGAFDVFNQGLGNSGAAQTAGNSDLSAATNYWRSLLSPGRTQAVQNAAPATNAVIAQSDAQRNQSGEFGTGRTGGTAAANQQADTAKNTSIDNIINENLIGGKTTAAQGLQSAGSTELSNAVANLGISGNAASNIMSNAETSYEYNQKMNAEQGAAAGQAASQLLDYLFL